jgi:RNA 2',3'-cyclic 3'-phosphodiesterase
MTRLFVAVWPTEDVVTLLERLQRPAVEGVRWTTPDQWHVTLRFLGWVEEADLVVDALSGWPLAAVGSAEAILGPRVDLLNPRIVSVPVAGLDDLAAAVMGATAALGKPPERRPFHGHVTLARLRGVRGSTARRLAGEAVVARWPVRSVAVVESRLSPRGARYETVAEVPLGPS